MRQATLRFSSTWHLGAFFQCGSMSCRKCMRQAMLKVEQYLYLHLHLGAIFFLSVWQHVMLDVHAAGMGRRLAMRRLRSAMATRCARFWLRLAADARSPIAQTYSAAMSQARSLNLFITLCCRIWHLCELAEMAMHAAPQSTACCRFCSASGSLTSLCLQNPLMLEDLACHVCLSVTSAEENTHIWRRQLACICLQ